MTKQPKKKHEKLNKVHIIMHCRYFAQRILNKDIQNEISLFDISFLEDISLSENYEKSKKCINQMSELMEKKYHCTVSNNEKIYFFIHLNRVINEY